MKVFLGGTVANSTWRDYMMPKLKVDYFNPVVEEWTEEDQKIEIHEREHCDFCLYVLTPKMIGRFSIAEVIDDSYKKSDKTIFCFLTEDDGKKFSKDAIKELNQIGELARSNGAVWKQNLDEVISFLNSASELANDFLLQQTDQINNVFISYGRRHSLAFARKLYQSLIDRNYDVWFDMNDIPLGVDFQEQIDDGIRKADNFIYIMSPHSINSIYCYKELVLALKYNKRIIPILHVEPQDDATWGKIPPEAGKRNWIYCRQDHDTALELSGKTFEIQEKILKTPKKKWKFTDDYNAAFESLITLIDSHRAYVRTHTILLDKSIDWKKASHSTQKLLAGKARQEAENFLKRSKQIFKNHTGHLIQPPCYPTDLLAQFVMQSKKNSSNMQCDLFICHDVDDGSFIKKILAELSKHRYSSWISSKDILKGEDFGQAIDNGIIRSANMIFFISEKSLNSKYCKKEYAFAQEHNKRIIPILLEEEPPSLKDPKGFPGLLNIQYINFTDHTDEVEIEVKDHSDVKADVEARREKTPFEISVDEIVHTLSYENTYYNEHRTFLVQAINWKKNNKKKSFLIRGSNLENAQTWLRLNIDKQQNAPTAIHEKYIQASEASKTMGSDVFIAYVRNDGDFARKLYSELQSAYKSVWFDQDSSSEGASLEKEIYNGIDNCDNLIFVISPEVLESKSTMKELEYANSQHKRIIPILVRETDKKDMPVTLTKANWLDFKDTSFEVAFPKLVQAIELDKEHAAQHTRIHRKATEWNEYERTPDFLLNTVVCEKSETWLEEAYAKKIKEVYTQKTKLESEKIPAPSALQIDYIQASRKGLYASALQKRNKKRLIGLLFSVLIVLIIALVMVKVAVYQANQANKAKAETEEQKKIVAEKTKIVKNITKDLEKEQKELENEKEKTDDSQDSIQKLLIENELERNKAEQERLKAILAKENAELLAFEFSPEDIKKAGFVPLWKKAKNNLSEFNYKEAYSQLLLANNTKDIPPEKKDSVEQTLEKAKKLSELYNKGIGHFYNNEFKDSKKCFSEIYSINSNDTYSLFYAKASTNPRTSDMIEVNKGRFLMGNANTSFKFTDAERPIHTVVLTKYYMAKYEVTNTQYVRFLNEYTEKYKNQNNYTDSIKKYFFTLSNAIYLENGIYKVKHTYENLPVTKVSWYGANSFCHFYGLQLPTEAQWEFAARGGNKSPMSIGAKSDFLFSGSNNINQTGWYWDNSGKKSHAVGTKKSNALGFCDMSGNVYEWCSDWYSTKYYAESIKKNPTGPANGTGKVFRGGSWYDDAESCRLAYRISFPPNKKFNYIGFRVVLVK